MGAPLALISPMFIAFGGHQFVGRKISGLLVQAQFEIVGQQLLQHLLPNQFALLFIESTHLVSEGGIDGRIDIIAISFHPLRLARELSLLDSVGILNQCVQGDVGRHEA
jgi:hypothetical protein